MRRILSALATIAALAGCSESFSPEDFYSVWGADGVRAWRQASRRSRSSALEAAHEKSSAHTSH